MTTCSKKQHTRVIVLNREVVGTTLTKKEAHAIVRKMRADGEHAFTFSVADYKKFIDPTYVLKAQGVPQ